MSTTAIARATATTPSALTPRVCLAPVRASRAALDGGWWPRSADPALAIATTDRGDQLDLLVVPPSTVADRARSAMAQAADTTDAVRAPNILAAVKRIPETRAR